MQDKNIVMAEKIAEKVSEAGGRTFYVGGLVRDRIMGRENKDIDIEIHGVTVQKLEEILDSLGDRTTMGASFGIMGLRKYDLDIAMPRSETATGRGHKDFEVFVDPFIGEKKAALRRDFTINAMMQDVLTGEILDFFGGREDIQKKVIRHVNDATFVEDPLRVFRAAQFAARFEFETAPETVELARGMHVDMLSSERIFGELEKAFTKAKRPSVFFEELKKMKLLSFWFPEVQALIGVSQDPFYHPEGDVWTHTMQVLDAAAFLKKDAENPEGLMFAALCHDFGKPVTSEEKDGRIHAYGHETKGLPIVKTALARITNEVSLTKYVLNMTELHMEPNLLASETFRAGKGEEGAGAPHEKAFMKMFDKSLCPEDLLLLAKADYLGQRSPKEDLAARNDSYREREEFLKQKLFAYRERMARPFVMGRDLIEEGVKPGPLMGKALEYAHKLRLAGVSKDDQLKQTLAYYHALQG